MTLPSGFLTRPIAHRALHGAGRPENSRAALRAAVAAGYAIEIDIQPSADGVPMVFHDYDLGRLTGETGPIRSRSAGELGQIGLLGGDEGIPTLEEVLETVAGAVPLLIEVKDQDGALGHDVGQLGQAVARVLNGYQGDVALMSFNPHAVATLAEAAPDRPRGLTTCAFPAEHWPLIPAPTRTLLAAIPDYDRVGACFISHQWQDLTHPRVEELSHEGAAILCWTIRSAEEEARARQIARNITFEGYTAAFPAA